MRKFREKCQIGSFEDMKKLLSLFGGGGERWDDCDVTLNPTTWIMVLTYPAEKKDDIDDALFDFEFDVLQTFIIWGEHSEC